MDLEHERQRLVQRDAEWAALASQGQDVERILSFWTDDARVYPPACLRSPARRRCAAT
jgi:hypothetical protein